MAKDRGRNGYKPEQRRRYVTKEGWDGRDITSYVRLIPGGRFVVTLSLRRNLHRQTRCVPLR